MLISIPFLVVTFLVYGLISELRNLHGKSLMCYVANLIVLYVSLSIIQLNGEEKIPEGYCELVGWEKCLPKPTQEPTKLIFIIDLGILLTSRFCSASSGWMWCALISIPRSKANFADEAVRLSWRDSCSTVHMRSVFQFSYW